MMQPSNNLPVVRHTRRSLAVAKGSPSGVTLSLFNKNFLLLAILLLSLIVGYFTVYRATSVSAATECTQSADGKTVKCGSDTYTGSGSSFTGPAVTATGSGSKSCGNKTLTVNGASGTIKEPKRKVNGAVGYICDTGFDTSPVTITKARDPVQDSNTKVNQTYDLLKGSVGQFEGAFNRQRGGAGCSSQGCPEGPWKQAVYDCWQSARSGAASGGRYGGQAGQPTDEAAETKNLFATCLSGKTGVSEVQIKTAVQGVDVAAVNGGNTLPPDPTAADAAGDEKSSCGIDGIGWIVCPVMSFLGDVMDNLFTLISGFLEVESDKVGHEATRTAWSNMRNIANIAFVIGFIFIIYSQLTGAGIGNYGVKKLLPRIIVAAILVNLSYIICQLAIDISNLLGYSLRNAFEAAATNTGVAVMEDASGNGWGIAVMITGLLLAGIGAAFAISIPVLLATLLAVLLIIGILLARKAFIIILTVISPLAFVAFLLPNTEQWYKKWYKTFLALLMVFPIISVVFGASKFVAGIVKSSASGPEDWLTQLTAIGIAAIPLFAVPSLLKGSMNAAGAIGAKLQGMANKQQGKAGGLAKNRLASSRLGEAQRGLKNRYGSWRAGHRGKLSRAIGSTGVGKRLGLENGLDNSRFGRFVGLDKGAAATTAALSDEDEKAVAQQLTMFKDKHGATGIGAASTAMQTAIQNGDSTTARAMQRYLAASGSPGVKTLESVYAASSDKLKTNQSLRKSLGSDALAGGIKSKSAAIDKYSTSDGSKDFSAIQQDKSTYSGLNAVELAGQKNLDGIIGQGSVDAGMASAILRSQAATDQLSLGNRAELERIAQGGTSTPPPVTAQGGGTAGDANSSGGGASSGRRTVLPGPDPASVPINTVPATTGTSPSDIPVAAQPQQPSARERAEQKIAEAAAGTSGGATFVVDRGGEVSHQTARQADEAAAAAESMTKVTDNRGGGIDRSGISPFK